MLPITLRHVQGDLRPAASSGQVRVKRLQSDADILAWYARLQHYHESSLPARELGLPESEWYSFETSKDARGRTVKLAGYGALLPLEFGDGSLRLFPASTRYPFPCFPPVASNSVVLEEPAGRLIRIGELPPRSLSIVSCV